jgi:hypothetical protein
MADISGDAAFYGKRCLEKRRSAVVARGLNSHNL